MLLVSTLLVAIVDFVQTAFIKMIESLDALERLIVGSASTASPPASSATRASPGTAATHEQDSSALGMLTFDSIQVDTAPATCECDNTNHEEQGRRLRMTQLIAENAQLTRKQEHLQQIVTDLCEYTLRLERNVELGDATTTRLTRELDLHKHLASSAIAMYHNARHQLAAAELRQSVALDYIDELVVKYGRQTRCSYDEGDDDDTDSALSSPCSTVAACDDDGEVFELEEI